MSEKKSEKKKPEKGKIESGSSGRNQSTPQQPSQPPNQEASQPVNNGVKKDKFTPEQFTQAESEFFANLSNLAERDKQAMGFLRRAVGCTVAETRNAMIPFYRILPSIYHNSKYEEIFFLIATLFSMDKNNTTYGHGKNFGYTMSQVYHKRESDTLQKQFAALLDGTFDLIDGKKMGGGEVPHRLAHLVKMANTEDVPIDWKMLFKDLKFWEQPSKLTQKKWASSFFGSSTPKGSGEIASQDDLTQDLPMEEEGNENSE